MSDNQKMAFLPFHAINEFMRDDFRRKVIFEVYMGGSSLSRETLKRINQLTRKVVEVQGFRDSLKSPLALRARAAEHVFEKSPAFVAAILSGWAELHDRLRQQVFELISELGWNPYPIDFDRSKLPGFLPDWPDNQDFEMLDLKFRETFPGDDESDDDINLMIVWLAVRLPYQHGES